MTATYTSHAAAAAVAERWAANAHLAAHAMTRDWGAPPAIPAAWAAEAARGWERPPTTAADHAEVDAHAAAVAACALTAAAEAAAAASTPAARAASDEALVCAQALASILGDDGEEPSRARAIAACEAAAVALMAAGAARAQGIRDLAG